MTAIDVKDRARSLADLPNSQLITSDDEVNSINETYHDVYDWLLQNDDDYYVTETTITLTASMQSATNLTANEFVVPLPTDFYRLRYLDYRSNNQWQEVNKLPLSARNISPASPMYRIRGAYLWLIGGMNIGSSYVIRMGYYPTPAPITLPIPTLPFGTSYGIATLQSISKPFFTNTNQTMVYVLSSTSIVSESIASNTVATPATLYAASVTISQMQYYKGYVYIQLSSNVYRAASGLSSAIATFAAVTATGDVTDFAIYKDLIYYTTTAAIFTCTLAGASAASLGAATTPTRPAVLGSSVYYVDGSNNLKLLGTATAIATAVSGISTEGLYLYIQDTSNNLMRATVTSTTLGALATLSTDCYTFNTPEVSITTPASALDQVYLPVITRETPQLLALGSSPPFIFSYPNNLFTEVMAYQMAVDFKSKAMQDPSLLAGRLGSRDVVNGCTGLWLRFYQSIKRDDHQPGRINNRYQQPWGIW